MSSLINIHIPKQAAKKLNFAAFSPVAQISKTAGAIRTQLYDSLVTPALDLFDSFTDRLFTDGGLHENNVVLCTNKGVLIEFINAKIDVTKQNAAFVATSVVNRAGKVKEYLQADDYKVKITGDLIGNRNKFPYPYLVLLNQILNEGKSINVASVYLYAFGITKLAFDKAEFKQSGLTYFNALPFELNFVSDRDYNFLVSE